MARSGTRVWGWAAFIVTAAVLLWIWSRPDRPEPGARPLRPSGADHVARRATEPASRQEGGIAGRVVDPDGGGVAGAVVTLFGPAPARGATPGKTFRTGRDGTFRFAGLVPGRYRAQARASELTAGFADNLAVDAGELLEDVRILLWRGGATLAGRVLDAGGGFIPGARVRATSYFRNASETHDARAFYADADAEGRYRLQLPRGRHTLSAVADGYAPVSEARELIGDQTRDFLLHPAARISGRVVSSEGRTPVEGARVSAQGQRGDRRGDSADAPGSVTTDERGGFELGSLAPGTYFLTARKEGLLGALAQPILVGATDAVDGLELVVSATRTVRGRVTSTAGAPLAGARISLSPLDVPARALGPSPWALADDRGRYVIDGVLSGNHRFAVSAEGYASHAEPIAVAADLARDVVLRDTAVITGIALEASGKPARQALVQGYIGLARSGDGVSADTFTDAAGRFVLTGLGGGVLFVTARQRAEVAVVGPEALEASGRKQVTIRFGSGARVAGVVSWDDGTPSPAAIVLAVPTGEEAARFEVMVPTGRDGSFAIHGLPPGGLRLRAVPVGQPIFERDEGSPPSEEASFTLAAGEQRTGLQLTVVRR
jgi:hypothetical protein